MQLDKPGDFIICTGEAHPIQEFLDEAFRLVGLNPNDYVEYDSRFSRPGKTTTLVGDSSKAKKSFGFDPKVKFKELVKLLIEHDKKEVEKELKNRG